MSDALIHIAAWEAAGLIDRPTADRLRAAAPSALPASEPGPTESPPAIPTRSAASALFGPSVTIAEVFAYLGGGFLVAAWSSLIGRATGNPAESGLVVGTMALIAAAVLAGMGLWLRRGGERASRAAGVTFLLAATYVGTAAAAFATTAGIGWPAVGIIASAAALVAATLLRVVHPSVLTQVGILGALTALALSTIQWLQVALFPEHISETTGLPLAEGPNPLILVLASAAWWLGTAVVIALIGLREARIAARDGDPGGDRRAAISRFWAGLVAVIGLATAVSRSATAPDGDFGRVLEPWIGDLALVLLSAVLIERAFRRDATSFIYAAALGLMVALTDFNLSYLSNSTEVALLIEGLILLGVGVAADRLRRRIGQDGSVPPGEPLANPTLGGAV